MKSENDENLGKQPRFYIRRCALLLNLISFLSVTKIVLPPIFCLSHLYSPNRNKPNHFDTPFFRSLSFRLPAIYVCCIFRGFSQIRFVSITLEISLLAKEFWYAVTSILQPMPKLCFMLSFLLESEAAFLWGCFWDFMLGF